MIKVKLANNMGMTLETLPESIFRYVTSINLEGGSIVMSIDDAFLNMLKESLSEAIGVGVTSGVMGGDYCIIARTAATPVESAEEAEESEVREIPRDEATAQQGPVGVDEEQVSPEPVPATTERIIRGAWQEMPCTSARVALTERTIVPQTEFEIFLSSKMNNALSGQSNLALSRIQELERIMGRALILRNEIAVLMKPITANEKIAKIAAQLKSLRDEDNLIRDVFLTKDGWIVMLTKNITTERIGDGSRREVGELAISINIGTLMSENSTTNSIESSVKVINLTRQVKLIDGSGKFECGHVYDGGKMCLGNMYEPILTALSNCEIIQAADILIRFVKNPDHQDQWGKAILGFPTVEAR